MADPLREALTPLTGMSGSHLDAVLATLVEHRAEVLALLGMERLPLLWCTTHGGTVQPDEILAEGCHRVPVYAAVPDTTGGPDDLDREREEADLNGSMDRGEGMP